MYIFWQFQINTTIHKKLEVLKNSSLIFLYCTDYKLLKICTSLHGADLRKQLWNKDCYEFCPEINHIKTLIEYRRIL